MFKINLFLLVFALYGKDAFTQTTSTKKTDTKTITYFEKYIIDGILPPDADVQTKYQSDMRIIVWNEPLTRDYKYSNEAFDKFEYELVKTNQGDKYNKSSKTYRNCVKGILIAVTEWNGKLSISMEWYSPNVRKSITYLMFCNTTNNNENIANIIKGTLYKANFYGKEGNDPYDNPTRENVEVFIGDSIIKVTLGNSSTTYKIYDKGEINAFDYLVYLGDVSNVTHTTEKTRKYCFYLSIHKINSYYEPYSIFLKDGDFNKLIYIPKAQCYNNYEINR